MTGSDIIKKLGIFNQLRGQEKILKRLLFYLDSYMDTEILCPILINGQKGGGKTTISKECGRALVLFKDGHPVMDDKGKFVRKPFIAVNCAFFKNNPDKFVDDILIKHVFDKPLMCVFDEAGSLPSKVSMLLLDCLNPNPTNKNTVNINGVSGIIDFKINNFIFATSQAHLIYPPLLDRLKRFDLDDYSNKELAEIIAKGARGIEFEKDVLAEMSSIVRANPRQAHSLANDVMAYVKKNKTFFRDDWQKFKSILDIKSLGLNAIEINIMRHLAMRPEGTSLTMLSSKTNLSRASMQKDNEIYLLRHGLVEVRNGKGRILTEKGINYLRSEGLMPV